MPTNPRPEYPTAQAAKINEYNVIEYGNINLNLRPIVKLKDGSIATIFSITITEGTTGANRVHTLIPTISDDGIKITEKEARILYDISGRHLGRFANLKSADKYAKFLSQQENARVKQQQIDNPDYLIGEKTWYPISEIKNPSNRNLGGILQLTNLYGPSLDTFKENLISVSVDYGIDLDAEISVDVIDEDYRMFESNYFVIRNDITYRGRRYEIAEISVGPGQGGSPIITIKARNKSIQQMRRDKTPGSVTGSSGYEFAGNAARKFGLQFVGQKTAKTKSTFQARTGDGEESVYDVLRRTAGNNQFVIFENDGVLVYASQEWLLWKFGSSTLAGPNNKKYVPLLFMPKKTPQQLAKEFLLAEANEYFELETWPNFKSSDNEPLAADGSCNVLMPQGAALRPGHTALVGPYPTYFFGGYLITRVSFNEGSPQPAQIQFRTPEEPKDQKCKPIKPRTGSAPGTLR